LGGDAVAVNDQVNHQVNDHVDVDFVVDGDGDDLSHTDRPPHATARP
jgi:hypothetical protein